MARKQRICPADIVYHVTTRGNGRSTVFHTAADYEAFIDLIGTACTRCPMRLLGFCLMPNHPHLVLWPYGDGDVSRWMQWLLTTHARRYLKLHALTGHVWQGRFHSFPVQQDSYLLMLLRYVERNPLRAKLVERAEQWDWSSARCWSTEKPDWLVDGPVERPSAWLDWLNEPVTAAELAQIRLCSARGAPYGEGEWTTKTAAELNLSSSLRRPGRPRKLE